MTMQTGDKNHKAQYVGDLIKLSQENIWTIEIQKLDAEKNLATKKAYLELIPKRMEEKFYPSANDGRQDEKDTKAQIQNLEANIERFAEMIEMEERKMEMVKCWAAAEEEI